MHALILQHAAFEGIGSIDGWLDRHRASVRTARLFAGDALPPTPAGIDLVIAMGGPMSVNDERTLPWLADEKTFLRRAIAENIAAVGICLGAQLIAAALGARVYANPEREIGWLPVYAVPTQDDGAFRFPREFTTFHWHGETFDLPAGGQLLAGSDGCPHQAFSIGRRVVGLQFHPEMTLSGARLLVEHCAADLTPGRSVQTADAILAGVGGGFAAGHPLMDRILDFVVFGIRSAAE
jgi:GMP synthase-like glutamine amidotransferase